MLQKTVVLYKTILMKTSRNIDLQVTCFRHRYVHYYEPAGSVYRRIIISHCPQTTVSQRDHRLYSFLRSLDRKCYKIIPSRRDMRQHSIVSFLFDCVESF